MIFIKNCLSSKFTTILNLTIHICCLDKRIFSPKRWMGLKWSRPLLTSCAKITASVVKVEIVLKSSTLFVHFT